MRLTPRDESWIPDGHPFAQWTNRIQDEWCCVGHKKGQATYRNDVFPNLTCVQRRKSWAMYDDGVRIASGRF